MRFPPALLLVAALLAGCTSEPPAIVDDESSIDRSSAEAMNRLRADVAGIECGTLEPIAMHALSGGGNWDEMAALERDGRTYVIVARYGEGGIDVVDATDPAAPELVASWVSPDPDYALDIKLLADNKTLAMAGGYTIRFVDLSNITEPTLESVHALERPSAHLIAVWTVDGQEYVSASEGEGKDIAIFRVDVVEGKHTLERVSHPLTTPLGDLPRDGLLLAHDSWFERDPTTGTPLLWIANVWWGIAALDVSDPTQPVLVSRTTNLDPYPGYVHSVQVTHLDGRRLVVATTEYGFGSLKVYDATDLAAPTLVGWWSQQLPTQALHNLAVVGDRAYVAGLHAGLFAFDLADLPAGPLPARMEPAGWLAPEAGVSMGTPTGFGAYEGPRDVIVHDGIVYTSETNEGLRAIADGCLTPGDKAQRSTG